MMENAPEQQQSPPQDTFWQAAVKLFARRGIVLIVALFLIEIALFFAVSSLPFFPGEQALYLNQSKQITNQFQNATLVEQFWGIFSNNYGIALRELIPGVGIVLFALSLYATARILQVVSIQQGVSPLIVVLILLLIFPHSWIELPAYAVATAESILIVYAFIRWLADTKGGTIRGRAEVGLLLINFIIVTVMLLIAAVFESVEIQLGLWFWVTWIPFAGLIAIVLVLNQRLMRIRKVAKTQ